MSETTATPSAAGDMAAAPETPSTTAAGATDSATTGAPGTDAAASMTQAMEKQELSIKSLLEAGVHFGHQTRRWDPRMRNYIFGSRNGTHILDLDQTLPLFQGGLDYIRDTVAEGGLVLFVGTKRQAAPIIEKEALRAGQYYVNNRWLGGMLTNWKTVKKSIDTYKSMLEILGDEDKRETLSKKELARISRQCEKYEKSLEGIKEMGRQPDVIFLIDVSKESIAISEGRRLGIPIVAVVDSNCNPHGIDYVVPGNDDAIRAIELYCRCVADACLEGGERHQATLRDAKTSEPAADTRSGAPGGRRVVEIKQPPRRSRGGAGGGGGGAGGRTHSSGGWAEKRAEEEAAKAKEAATTEPAPEGDAPS